MTSCDSIPLDAWFPATKCSSSHLFVMKAFLKITCLLMAIAPQAAASIFTVKPNTIFYLASDASELTLLKLP